MRIKNIIKKNIFLILLLAVVILFGIAYHKTEGFQGGLYYVGSKFRCNFNYCTGDYEVVTKNGVQMCLKKCSAIYSNAVTSLSDPTVCNRIEKGRTTTSFSRNIIIHKKLNVQGNNACEFPCPFGYTNINEICTRNPTRTTVVTANCSGFTVNSIPGSRTNPCISCGPLVYPSATVLPGRRVDTFYPIPKNQEQNATFKCEIPMRDIRSSE